MRISAFLRPCILTLFASLATGGPSQGLTAFGVAFGPTLDVPFLANHYFQTVAVLADGSLAISGTTTTPGEQSHPQFEVQTYDADGLSLGGPFVPEKGKTVDTGGVLPLSDHYFVSWQHYLAKTSAGTFLSRTGDPLTPPAVWPNSDIEYYHAYYAHGARPTYRFLPVMYHLDGVDPLDNPIRQPTLQVHGSDATPIGAPVSFSSGPSRIYIDQMAINGEGRFVIVYQRCAKAFVPVKPCPLGLQVFAATGQPQTPLLTGNVPQAESAQGSLSGGVHVGIEPGGKFLLLWTLQINTNLYRLFARLFGPTGAPLSQPLQLAEAPAPGIFEEQVRGLADGSFALAWAVAGDAGSFALYVSRFDPFSLQASPPLLITTDRLAAEDYHFDVNDSGQGILTWVTYHPENPDNVFAGYAKLLNFRPYRKPKAPPARKQRP